LKLLFSLFKKEIVVLLFSLEHKKTKQTEKTKDKKQKDLNHQQQQSMLFPLQIFFHSSRILMISNPLEPCINQTLSKRNKKGLTSFLQVNKKFKVLVYKLKGEKSEKKEKNTQTQSKKRNTLKQ
jgi:hypothetical protein